jgi:hypothetical protein
MYSKKDVPGEDFLMSIEKRSQIGILSIPDTKDGANHDYLVVF